MANIRRIALIAALLLLSAGSPSAADALGAEPAAASSPSETSPAEPSLAASLSRYDEVVQPFFARHCSGCHGARDPEGDLDLARLEPDMKATSSAARWAMLLDKLVRREMPPEGEPPPPADQTGAVVAWIQAEMKRAGKHVAHREQYANGNQVPHALLFGPGAGSPLESTTRARRLSPAIYDALTNKLARGANGIGQPFSVAGNTTFADMGAPKVDEPTTAQLLRNALLIVGHQTATRHDRGESKWVGQKEFQPLLDEKSPATDEQIEQAISVQFDKVLRRKPAADELARFVKLYHKNVADAGRATGARYTLAAVFLLPDAVFRWEVGSGPADAQGRVRLDPREIAVAINYALTDEPPADWLLRAADEGQLDTAEGVGTVVGKLLDDPKLRKPRILRFFREYFDYAKAPEVFKDKKLYNDYDARVLVDDTDRLIEYILEQDREVFKQLLTTNKAFVAHRTAEDNKKKRAEALKKFLEEKKKNPEKFRGKEPRLPGRSIYLAYSLEDFPDRQPTELPQPQRAGILTQPAWLIAFSTADDNHAIHRGKWIRERLLGNVVPDIPITVDAQLPNAPDKTLRERMAVTREQYCWKCHQLMNPVGLPFESFDHVGRFRTAEPVLDVAATEKNVDKKGNPQGPVMREIPVDASGRIDQVGVEGLEHDVNGAVEMLHRLAESEYVEQVFVRHAFRYWLGRNETPGDAASLQAAHRAYRSSGGSMKELITGLLTSEAFLYRVKPEGSSQAQVRNDPADGPEVLRP